MTFSASSATSVNKMNTYAKRTSLGTEVRRLGTLTDTLSTNMTVSGSLTVTAAQATASAIVIQTGVSVIEGNIVQATRSGSALSGVKTLTSGSNLNITSASPTLWVIAADDAINYIVW
jgi:hypothetical protein